MTNTGAVGNKKTHIPTLKTEVNKAEFRKEVSEALSDNKLDKNEFMSLAKKVSGGEKELSKVINQLNPNIDVENSLNGNGEITLTSKNKATLNTVLSNSRQGLKPKDFDYINGRLDYIVTDGEIDEILDKVSGMSKLEVVQLMNKLESKGRLDDFLGNMTDTQLDRYVSLLAGRGIVEIKEDSYHHNFDGYRGNPKSGITAPYPPKLATVDSRLPASLQKALDKDNINKSAEYKNKFNDYMTEYCDALDKCKTIADIRKLGKPAFPAEMQEPGKLSTDFARTTMGKGSAFPMYKKLSKTIHRIKNTIPPGSFYVSVEVKKSDTMKGVTGAQASEWKIGADAFQYDEKKSAGYTASVDNKKVQGSATYEVEVNSKGEVKNKVSVSGGEKVGRRVRVEVDDQGGAQLGVGVGADTKAGQAYGEGFTGYDPSTATVTGGVKVGGGVKFGKDGRASQDGEITLAINFKGMTEDEIYKALTGPGFQW